MPGPGPGPGGPGPGPGPGPVPMQVNPRSPQAPPQPQRNVLHRPQQGPPPGQGFPPNGVPPPGRGFDPRMGPPPGGLPPMGTSKAYSAMSRSDIFGLQGWTPGCKGPHLGILNIAVHHQDQDKCQCRVSLLSKSISRPHLWAPWAPWDQDMECPPHSNNKGVEFRSINGDKHSRPGRDWKEHTRPRPLDPHLCAIIQSLVLFYWTLSACDGPRRVACLNDFYYLFLVPTSYLRLHVFETSTSLYGFDDSLRSFYRIFCPVVIELRTCTSGRAGLARTEIEMVLLAFRPSLARCSGVYTHGGKI